MDMSQIEMEWERKNQNEKYADISSQNHMESDSAMDCCLALRGKFFHRQFSLFVCEVGFFKSPAGNEICGDNLCKGSIFSAFDFALAGNLLFLLACPQRI